MKCSKCGHTTRTLPAMAEHYRKKHPAAMKRGKEKVRKPRKTGSRGRYCPTCGQPV